MPIGVVKSMLLADRDEADAGALQPLQRLERDAQVAGEAVELVDDDHVEQAGLGVGQHPGERRALGQVVGAGALALVAVDLGDRPAVGLAVEAGGPVLGVEASSPRPAPRC